MKASDYTRRQVLAAVARRKERWRLEGLDALGVTSEEARRPPDYYDRIDEVFVGCNEDLQAYLGSSLLESDPSCRQEAAASQSGIVEPTTSHEALVGQLDEDDELLVEEMLAADDDGSRETATSND